MNQPDTTIAESACTIRVQYCPSLNYSLQQNGIALISSVVIHNNTQTDYEQLSVCFAFSPDYAVQTENVVVSAAAGTDCEIRKIPVSINAEYLASLTERVNASLSVEVKRQGETVARAEFPVSLFAFDECFGFMTMPELLGCFAQPNHPDIPKLLYNASKLLEQWTGSGSLDAYQSEDRDRVLKQAAAIYGALQQCNITYAVPPAGFERQGQRIRTADVILKDHLGTCLDLALLYCSCAEAAGLNPLLIVVKEHAFAGVWLEPECFSETVQDDETVLSKRIAKGVETICLVETTTLCSGKSVTFEQARQTAEQELAHRPFTFLVDIRRARSTGIRPLPRRQLGASGLEVVHEERPEDALTTAPGKLEYVYPKLDDMEAQPKTRFEQWQLRLLDLSRRNALISLRLTRSMLPVLTHRLERLEDALQSGREFRLLPRSVDWNIELTSDMLFEPAVQIGEYADALELDFSGGQIRIPYTDVEVEKSVVQLYRQSRVSMEENGANTLYLALGALKWYESKTSVKPRYAPIVLLPVELIRKSARIGYVVRLRDDEPQMNITLLEMLRQEFRIDIQGLHPLPQDAHGLDIRMILSVMRQGVMHMERWDVAESAFLGNFSFAQFVMWNDLNNRAADLKRNKLVRSLEKGKLEWLPKPLPPSCDENAAMLPVPSDGSQLIAIQAAAEGKTFVLHGPPGTGKSQTITAMIANALTQGKTVLFVAEKMAALNVVKKRLDRIGIGTFCLELHSNKARKKDVLDQLDAALNMAGKVQEEDYAGLKARKESMQAQLEAHKAALHKPYEQGVTLYQAIARFEQFSDAPDAVAYTQAQLDGLTQERLRQNDALANELISAAALIGHPHLHPLDGIGLSVYTQQARSSAEAAIQEMTAAILILCARASALAMECGQAADGSVAQLSVLYRMAQELMQIRGIEEQAHTAREHAAKLVSPNVFGLSVGELPQTLQTAENSGFFRSLGIWRKLRRTLAPYAAVKLNRKGIRACVKQITEVNAYEAEAEQRKRALGYRVQTAFSAVYISAEKYLQACSETKQRFDALNGTLELTTNAMSGADSVSDVSKRLEAWHENLVMLRDFTVWNYTKRRAIDAGMSSLVEALESGLQLDRAKDAYQKGLYRGIAESIFRRDELCNHFNGLMFHEKVESFKRLDAELCELTKQEIICRIASKLPNLQHLAAQSSELGLLRRAIRSGGRGIAIRKLIEQTPTLMPRLSPCMLMSPISAAQYLDPKRSLFDLVIFDEASQMPTCEAVGVLARAKEAVIVGDPHQMPPTSFFTADMTDDEHPELDDLESILDDCLALSIPDTHLLWHYRSRHESLIAFSNREYYENSLFTFPSPDAGRSMVRFVRTEGYYDRGRTRQNRGEAEAIVGEAERRLRSEPTHSVGIVTFSAVQQALIEDLLNELYIRDPEMEAKALQREEPLFVKNLENVQGDERDVILFSVCYGADRSGHVTMNFGPLNRDGGWRRLNVAITRAREEMVIFSTLTPDQIDLNRSHARGVENLKAFLEFAIRGARDRRTAESAKDGLAHRIAERLKENGYIADVGVGVSKFRVDVAVMPRTRQDCYLMAILLDGEGYASTLTVHDREISNESVLCSLGWRVLRVYAIDWWEDENRELERIIAALTKAESEAAARPAALPETPAAVSKHAPQQAPAVKQEQSAAPPPQEVYRPVVLQVTPMSAEQLMLRQIDELQKRMMAVLSAEAPITENLLYRRVLDSYAVARAGSRITNRLRLALSGIGMPCVTECGNRVYYPQKPQDDASYRVSTNEANRRDAKDLPLREIANAEMAVLRQQFGLPKDDLLRETAKLLGYARVGANLQEALAAGLDLLLSQGRHITLQDGMVRLNES